MKHAINWFAVPTNDLSRAVKFYSSILGSEIEVTQMGPREMAFFPADDGAISGHLFKADGFKPSPDGVMIYLNGGNDLQVVLDKVENAGGKIIMPKTQITPEIGYYAIFIDSEGNRVALHSNN